MKKISGALVSVLKTGFEDLSLSADQFEASLLFISELDANIARRRSSGELIPLAVNGLVEDSINDIAVEAAKTIESH